MGIPPVGWDRHKLLCDGTDNYVPWTILQKDASLASLTSFRNRYTLIIKLSFEFVCFKQNQLLMFCSVVHLDDMRERCCQCGTKTSKQDQQWVRNMSRCRKELIELIEKHF